MALSMNASGACPPTTDNAFGPTVAAPCRDGFDFTFTFEQYFFIIAPCALVLVAAPPRLYFLSRLQPMVDGKGFKLIKLSAIAILSCLQLAIVVLWATHPNLQIQNLPLAASILAFVTALILAPLSYLEHSRSMRPSTLLNVYLFLTLLFDAAMLRTIWLMPSFSSSIREIYIAAFVVKCAIVLLEAREKQKYSADSKDLSPEEFSGIYSRGLFWWLNKMIWAGTKQILKPMDLYPITKDMAAETLSHQFRERWDAAIKAGNPRLVLALFAALKWYTLLPILPRLAQVAFTLCQPLLLRRLLNYLADRGNKGSSNIGYGLVGAYAVVYVGMAITNALYWHFQYRFLAMLRGSLITAVFEKATELSLEESNSAKSVTLMSTDVERTIRGLLEMHDMWANVIQVAIATWLIENELGVACVAPIAIALMTLTVTMGLATFTTKFQMAWVGMIEKRIGFTSSVLASMKSIKILGLSSKIAAQLHKSRIREVDAAAKYRILGVFSSSLGSIPMLISPVVTFAIFISMAIKNNTTLDPTKLFTSLSLLILLSEPLFSLFLGVMDLMSAIGCFDRIEKFLLSTSQADKRVFIGSNLPTSGNRPILSQEMTDIVDLPVLNKMALTIRNGAFGWSKTEPSVLRNIDLTISKGQLVAIVGPVGCGKSTLLKAILGESLLHNGEVQLLKSDIAWCEQEAWLVNASVQKNIIGFSEFDSLLYRDVIHCCDLAQDLATLPKGDQTTIGSKGMSLSGGQKQRVAIARALYSCKDVAIFDDIFSQLDMTTQNKIFSRVLGPQGILRRRNTTVILATHASRFLRYTDYVVVLSDKGTISEQGSFDELVAAGGYISPGGENAGDSIDLTEEQTSFDVNLSSHQSDAAILQTNDLAQDKARQTGDFTVYRYYFSCLSWKIGVMFLIFQVSYAFLTTFPAIWLKWWADSNTKSPNKNNTLYIGVYAGFQVSALISSGLVTWWSFHIMAAETGLKLHQIIVKTVMTAPLTFFSATDSGTTLTRFSQDIQLLDMSLPLALQVVVSNAMICTAQIGLIASASAWLILSFPALFIVFYFVQKYYLRTSRQMRLLDIEEKAPLYTHFTETLEGLATIRAFSWKRLAIAHSNTLVDRSQKPFYLMYTIQRWLSLVLDLIIAALAVMVVGVSVGLRDTISSGFTGVSLTQIISFSSYLKLMVMFWTQMETSIGAVARIRAFASETPREENNDEVEPPEDWPSRGEVKIMNASARYRKEEEATALSHINLAIKPGEKVGICGRTGSGKSSLVLTLFRMLDLCDGQICIDGQDIATLTRESVRRQLAVITDAPFIMPGTIRHNLDPDGYSTDDKITVALKKSQIWDAIDAKGGLDADMEGCKLSLGQKQLFNIAGAILKKSGKVLVMDEATSSIDHETDRIVQNIIREEFLQYTIIYIAHRLDTILDFDRVAVMDKGQIVECDDPRILLQRSSLFRSLYDSFRLKQSVEKGVEPVKNLLEAEILRQV